MIEKIYSKIEENKLLHIIYRPEQVKNNIRESIVPEENFIQCSFLNLNEGKTFRPHKHIFKTKTYLNQIAQESWIVLKGSVRCIFYDLDNKIITTSILKAGEASFTLQGGHNYEILENDTSIYEYKTGPYEGQSLDKEFIDEV